MRQLLIVSSCLIGLAVNAHGFRERIESFLENHCSDCHAEGASKGGLDLDQLTNDLAAPEVFARWELIHDRIAEGEMPPAKVEERPTSEEKAVLAGVLGEALTKQHSKTKGTVLRRLNRREYQNTMNDLFGTNLKLEEMLPEDGRSHEFDTVGAALGMSMVHLERYLDAARLVFDTAVEDTTAAPKPSIIHGTFRESEIEKHLGKSWRRLEGWGDCSVSRRWLSFRATA